MSKTINCPNCGAVITGSKCEYCGTIFETKNLINLKGDNFKIELNVNGEDILAYISSVQVEYNRISQIQAEILTDICCVTDLLLKEKYRLNLLKSD